MASLERRSLRSVRLSARAPRWALFAVVGVLCIRGLLETVRPAPASLVAAPVRPATPAVVPVGASGFAEGFVRAYLSYDAGAPQRRELELRPYVGGDLDEQADFALPLTGARRVMWTATVGQRRLDRWRAAVTVAAAVDDSAGLSYVAVVVTCDRSGAMAVTDPPAFVGAPAVAAGVDGEGGEEVSDGRLRVVVRRALTNYLAGARDNLRADLTAEAWLAPPPSSLRLTDLTDLRRVGSGAVAATVLAEDRAGAVYTLRYVLAVVRRDRWYVAGLLTDPIAPKEGTR